jgi:hypothetical protein
VPRGKQGPDDFDAVDAYQFVGLLEAQRHAALQQEFCQRHPRRCLNQLARQPRHEAPAFEQVEQGGAARPGRIADALSPQQHRLPRIDARQRRAGFISAHCHHDAGARDLKPMAGIESSLRAKPVNALRIEHCQFQRFALGQPSDGFDTTYSFEAQAGRIVSAHQLRYEIRDGSLVVLNFALDRAPRQTGMTQRAGSVPSPGALALIRQIEASVARTGNSS